MSCCDAADFPPAPLGTAISGASCRREYVAANADEMPFAKPHANEFNSVWTMVVRLPPEIYDELMKD